MIKADTVKRLRKRRRRLLGSIVVTQLHLARQTAALRDLERRILILKPNFDPAKGPPGRPRGWHRNGQHGRLGQDIVRLL